MATASSVRLSGVNAGLGVNSAVHLSIYAIRRVALYAPRRKRHTAGSDIKLNFGMKTMQKLLMTVLIATAAPLAMAAQETREGI